MRRSLINKGPNSTSEPRKKCPSATSPPPRSATWPTRSGLGEGSGSSSTVRPVGTGPKEADLTAFAPLHEPPDERIATYLNDATKRPPPQLGNRRQLPSGGDGGPIGNRPIGIHRLGWGRPGGSPIEDCDGPARPLQSGRLPTQRTSNQQVRDDTLLAKRTARCGRLAQGPLGWRARPTEADPCGSLLPCAPVAGCISAVLASTNPAPGASENYGLRRRRDAKANPTMARSPLTFEDVTFAPLSSFKRQ